MGRPMEAKCRGQDHGVKAANPKAGDHRDWGENQTKLGRPEQELRPNQEWGSDHRPGQGEPTTEWDTKTRAEVCCNRKSK